MHYDWWYYDTKAIKKTRYVIKLVTLKRKQDDNLVRKIIMEKIIEKS